MSEIILTDQNFEEETKDGVALVDFWAPWCGPCQQQDPIIEDIAKEINDAKICKINVDENPQSSSKYGVMSIPTFIIFKNGKPQETLIGFQQKENLKRKIKEALK